MPVDPSYAVAPFDHAKADVILRSSDNIDFRVFKLFLTLASSFFETLFSIPQPTGENEDQEIKDGLVVVPVTEDSKTLDALLRFCYPCTLANDPNIEVLKDAMDVLEAARKYSLDTIEKKARQAILNPKILEAEPLRCFAIACRGRLRGETLLAARYTLTQPLIPTWFQELEMITATDLLSLLTYHRRCGEAVYALRLDLSWITSHYKSSEACSWLSGQWCYLKNDDDENLKRSGRRAISVLSMPVSPSSNIEHKDCGCLRSYTSKYALFDLTTLRWWDNFMEETFTALRDKPCKEVVQESAQRTVRIVKADSCKACSPKVTEGMRDFLELFTRKIEETVAQIKLELKFE